MSKHRYTAFIDEDLFDDMKKVKILTGYSINKLLNRAARKTLDEVTWEMKMYQENRDRLQRLRTRP